VDNGTLVHAYRAVINDKPRFLKHIIFCTDDDRVEVIDDDENVLVTFCADCRVIAGNKDTGEYIGRISTDDGKNWVFSGSNKLEGLYVTSNHRYPIDGEKDFAPVIIERLEAENGRHE
jgi:hypothetical protein